MQNALAQPYQPSVLASGLNIARALGHLVFVFYSKIYSYNSDACYLPPRSSRPVRTEISVALLPLILYFLFNYLIYSHIESNIT